MSTSRTRPLSLCHVSSSTTLELRSSSWDGNAVTWRGRPSWQHPADLIRYQEIICESRPDWIIETGAGGGTTVFLRDVCALINHGFVIAIEEDSLTNVPAPQGSVMAILDSDVYSREHMVAELEAYAPLVTEHLIVCHTDREDWGAAPALSDYLENNQESFREVSSPSGSLCTYLERVVQ